MPLTATCHHWSAIPEPRSLPLTPRSSVSGQFLLPSPPVFKGPLLSSFPGRHTPSPAHSLCCLIEGRVHRPHQCTYSPDSREAGLYGLNHGLPHSLSSRLIQQEIQAWEQSGGRGGGVPASLPTRPHFGDGCIFLCIPLLQFSLGSDSHFRLLVPLV